MKLLLLSLALLGCAVALQNRADSCNVCDGSGCRHVSPCPSVNLTAGFPIDKRSLAEESNKFLRKKCWLNCLRGGTPWDQCTQDCDRSVNETGVESLKPSRFSCMMDCRATGIPLNQCLDKCPRRGLPKREADQADSCKVCDSCGCRQVSPCPSFNPPEGTFSMLSDEPNRSPAQKCVDDCLCEGKPWDQCTQKCDLWKHRSAEEKLKPSPVSCMIHCRAEGKTYDQCRIKCPRHGQSKRGASAVEKRQHFPIGNRRCSCERGVCTKCIAMLGCRKVKRCPLY